MKKPEGKQIMTKSDANKILLWLGAITVSMAVIITFFLIQYPESEKIVGGVGVTISVVVFFVVGKSLKNYYIKKHS